MPLDAATTLLMPRHAPARCYALMPLTRRQLCDDAIWRRRCLLLQSARRRLLFFVFMLAWHISLHAAAHVTNIFIDDYAITIYDAASILFSLFRCLDADAGADCARYALFSVDVADADYLFDYGIAMPRV